MECHGTTSSILQRIFRVNTNNPLTRYLPQFVADRFKHYRNDQHQKSDALTRFHHCCRPFDIRHIGHPVHMVAFVFLFWILKNNSSRFTWLNKRQGIQQLHLASGANDFEPFSTRQEQWTLTLDVVHFQSESWAAGWDQARRYSNRHYISSICWGLKSATPSLPKRSI